MSFVDTWLCSVDRSDLNSTQKSLPNTKPRPYHLLWYVVFERDVLSLSADIMSQNFRQKLRRSTRSSSPVVRTFPIQIRCASADLTCLYLDFYRLALPDNTPWPATQFVSKDGSESVVFAFQQKYSLKPAAPPIRLQGLDPKARYFSELDNGTYTGRSLMNGGINIQWDRADYQSKLIWFKKQ